MWHKILIVASIAVLGGVVSLAAPRQTSPGAPAAVGVFQSDALVVAFYRSDIWRDEIAKMTQERDRAKAAKDEKRVAELERKGAAAQELAHQQLAGEARIDNIREHLEKALPDVARAAHVSFIVSDFWYRDPAAPVVDVTDQLIQVFKPDAATLKVIEELHHGK